MASSVTWARVRKAARDAGARHPDLVAAQWALESGWGKHVSGRNNYFGLKGGGGTECETTEYIGGKKVTIRDTFLDFKSLDECVNYLVERWYKDWKEYKGVNNCENRVDAAHELVRQGYATDPSYAKKLIDLMLKHGRNYARKTVEKTVFKIEAVGDTWLKSEPKNAADLKPSQRLAIPKGKVFGVKELIEFADTAHAKVTLASSDGTWYIWEPHWYKLCGTNEPENLGLISWNDFGASVTENLTVGEVLQWDKRRIPSENSADRFRILKAAAEFQKIREAWGQPLGVTSFYRPEPVNTEVGGVPNSRHTTGEAFDIYPVNRTVEEFYQWISIRWTGALGDARPRGYLHLDIRDGGCFVPGAGVRPCATWSY